ncbi:MAG TPA: hypothetical protein VGJ95_16090 [Pseudonocardiaceae bacterium]
MEALARLVEEASKKAGIVWITVPGERARPAWHHWHDGADHVVTGGLEQPLPGLADGVLAEVTVPSKDTGRRLVTWVARATEVPPGGPQWEAVVPAMHAKRLNPPDGDRQPQRWAEECTLLRLEPTGEVREAPGAMPDGSGAAPPAPTPASTSGPLPFVLGRRSSRR